MASGIFKYVVVLFAMLVMGCSSKDAYYAIGPKDKAKETEELLRLLRDEKQEDAGKFVLIQQIAHNLMAVGSIERLNVFLTTYVEKNPNDSFNAYYLYLVGQNYSMQNSPPIAAYYYNRVLRNHPDIIVQGNSIHFNCLQELIHLTKEPEYRINYYKEIQGRFPNKVDPGSTYYYMGKTYETLGEWEQAIQMYTKFLKYPETVIPENPDARQQIANYLAFHASDKKWIRESLEEIVNEIKNAIAQRDVKALLNLRAQVNFFAMSWEQDESESYAQAFFDLGTFLRGSTVRYAENLDIDSNAQEAYLETWGWTYRISTWYLYFRKIHYPQDPSIHGRWEWAGIYFGEKL
ncbi:MAG: tetratricopeptide repeat protein [Spirochaetales bacterium]|nr:tetratricopeptide repeat protein [Spirochaetales bacterium]